MKQNTAYPLISIAMATYNGEKYIRQQLDSIYAQTYPNIEVVVCDDGSTDNTIEILKQYEAEKGLQLHQNSERLGYMKNFEKVLTLCHGEFIALSDQDDLWTNNKLECFYQNIGDNLFIHSDHTVINPDNEVVIQSFRREYHQEKYERLFLSNDHHKYMQVRANMCYGCTSMIHRDLLKYALPIPASEVGHDLWFAFVAGNLNKVVYVDQCLTSWRVHWNNTSLRRSSKLILKLGLDGTPIHEFYRALRACMNMPKEFKLRKHIYQQRTELLKKHQHAVTQYPLGFLLNAYDILTEFYFEPKQLLPYRV